MMMKLDKLSAAKRRKNLATDTRPIVNPFIRWDTATQSYLGVLEVYDHRTGESYELSMGQVVWNDMHRKLMEAFAKDAHA